VLFRESERLIFLIHPLFAQTLGIGVPAIKTLIHRLRQRHAQLVRQEVERTASETAEVDAEVHALCEALIAAEGRIRL
jgi:hypothetical protein